MKPWLCISTFLTLEVYEAIVLVFLPKVTYGPLEDGTYKVTYVLLPL